MENFFASSFICLALLVILICLLGLAWSMRDRFSSTNPRTQVRLNRVA